MIFFFCARLGALAAVYLTTPVAAALHSPTDELHDGLSSFQVLGAEAAFLDLSAGHGRARSDQAVSKGHAKVTHRPPDAAVKRTATATTGKLTLSSTVHGSAGDAAAGQSASRIERTAVSRSAAALVEVTTPAESAPLNNGTTPVQASSPPAMLQQPVTAAIPVAPSQASGGATSSSPELLRLPLAAAVSSALPHATPLPGKDLPPNDRGTAGSAPPVIQVAPVSLADASSGANGTESSGENATEGIDGNQNRSTISYGAFSGLGVGGASQHRRQQQEWDLSDLRRIHQQVHGLDEPQRQIEFDGALQHAIDVRKSFSTMVRAWVIHLGVLLIGMGVVVLTVLANAEVIANSAAYRMRLRVLGTSGAGSAMLQQQQQQLQNSPSLVVMS